LDPARLIVDPHHHIWPAPPVPGYESYKAEDLLEDMTDSGHTFVATVCVDSHANWRESGPTHLRPVGETEFVERLAERCALEGGKIAGACRGIVPHANLTLGSAVEEVLLAHRAASPRRFCGIRQMTISDPDYKGKAGTRPHLLESKDFRAGFGCLARHGLSFDAWMVHPQLPELIALAREFPETTIVLNHIGGPIGVGRYAGRRQEGFEEWRSSLALLAKCENVFIKVGGLHNPMMGLTRDSSSPPRTSLEMAHAHREHILVAIELFGVSRCMFESDFPVSRIWTSCTVLWNAFKRITADFSEADKDALFRGVATRVYKLS
jgi:predicted TIM-barrel fold metal-dependent hydrolase